MTFRLNSDSRFTQVARGVHLRPKTTDLPSTLWPLPFNHVLSADTKFRYASKSKFLSSGLVITVRGVRQNLAISKRACCAVSSCCSRCVAGITHHRRLPSSYVVACSSLRIRVSLSVLETPCACIHFPHAPPSHSRSVFSGGRSRK